MLYPDLTINEKIKIMKTKVKNIHDHIWFNYDGEWICDLVGYAIFISPFDILKLYAVVVDAAWKRYYDDCMNHIKHMQNKKGKISEAEWQMQHSVMAPNKPGYTRANND